MPEHQAHFYFKQIIDGLVSFYYPVVVLVVAVVVVTAVVVKNGMVDVLFCFSQMTI